MGGCECFVWEGVSVWGECFVWEEEWVYGVNVVWMCVRGECCVGGGVWGE